MNLYAYVDNSPLNYVDPLGQYTVVVQWSAAEVLAAGAVAVLAWDAVRQESLSRQALRDTLALIEERRQAMGNAYGEKEDAWVPRTRDRDRKEKSGEDPDVTAGIPMTQKEREQLRDAIHREKKRQKLRGDENLTPEEIKGLRDEILGKRKNCP